MEIQELEVELNAHRTDPSLLVRTNLQARAEALDFLRFAREVVRMQRPVTPAWRDLDQKAETLQIGLEAVNVQLFQEVRTAIQAGTLVGPVLRHYAEQFTDYATNPDHVYISYDGLDVLVDGLFQLRQAPAPTLTPEAEMVHCEETPARAILDLIDQVGFTPQDVFYDLGSGLGQIVMLVHLLTGVRARGVEIEPAFCAFAQQQAQTLGLTGVEFINSDARTADYSAGTLFFMFTPFRGKLLQAVLDRLQDEARRRPIRICTFGPCTPRLAEQPWLRPLTPDSRHEYKLIVFESYSSIHDSL